METGEGDSVSVFVDNSQRTENVESVVNPALRIFEVQFLKLNNAYQSSLLVYLEDLVSDLGTGGFCLGLDLLKDFSGQKDQLFVVSGSLSSF